MASSRLLTLGSFEFSAGNVVVAPPSTQKARALLAYLAMHGDTDVGRERVLDLFWPDADPERARHSLKTATWSIRRGMRLAGLEPDEFLSVAKLSMRWIADTEVDATRFIELAASGDPGRHAQALALYRGEFLEGDFEEWTIAERERLSAEYERLLARMLKASPDPAIAERLVVRNPYDEAAYVPLIEAEIAAGRRFAATVFVDRCRQALAEVGAVPSADFERRFGALAVAPPSSGADVRLPFTGREAELQSLARSFAAASERRGSVTIVSGEAGIGKSSLMDRARRLAVDAGLRVIFERGVDGDPRSYGPWGQLFEAFTGVRFADVAAAGGDQAAARLAENICSELGEPAAFLVDDAQSLRAEAFDVFAGIASLAASSGHAVVVAVRPEAFERMQRLFANHSAATIGLAPLTKDELRRAVRQSLGGETSALVDMLFERTRGHPLFFGELFASLWRDGTLRRDGTRVTFADRSAPPPLPESLRRFIAARISTAGEDAVSVVCALALDPDATTSDLVDVVEFDEPRVLDAIDEMLTLGILDQPPSGPAVAFSHDLIRETAATMLGPGRRVRMHAAFSRRLDGATQRDAALRRARHLVGAGQPMPAARAYLDAAIEALEWFAWRDALDRCRAGMRALDDAVHHPEGASLMGRLELNSGRALVAGGHDDEAAAPASAAVERARTAGDRMLLMEAQRVRAQILINRHDVDDALAAAEEAASIAAESGDDAVLAQALILVESAHCHYAREDDAVRAGREALEAARRCGKPDVVTAAADQLIRTLIPWWRFSEALEAAMEGMRNAKRAGWVLEGAFHFVQGCLWYYLERYDDAERDFRKALQIAEDTAGERRWLISLAGIDRLKLRFFTRYMLAVVAAARGRWEEALASAEELDGSTLSQTSYMVRNNVLNLWIEALLGRDAPGDPQKAFLLAKDVRDDEFEQGSILDLSASADLTRARTAARLRMPEAAGLIDLAAQAVARHAAAAPMECDRAYAVLARASADAGLIDRAKAASSRQAELRAVRIAAAGAAWGGSGAIDPALTNVR